MRYEPDEHILCAMVLLCFRERTVNAPLYKQIFHHDTSSVKKRYLAPIDRMILHHYINKFSITKMHK